ncbi:MAG: hypothetical protein VB085_07685 [Peptococcaceae bacterium]|nr:hypothetical protein [Peptococcaceae bacterium]
MKRKKLVRVLIFCGALLAALGLGLWLWLLSAHRQQFVFPEYEKADLSPAVERALAGEEPLAEADYRLLFWQTGLGPVAVEALRQQADFPEKINEYQENFFRPRQVLCRHVFFPVWQEWLETPEGKNLHFSLAPLEEGYVLLTRSTHCLGWRMGHAGLVVDKQARISLESSGLGYDSALEEMGHWEEYPTFIMLRLRDADEKELAGIAAFARENLLGAPYRISAGFWGGKVLSEGLQKKAESFFGGGEIAAGQEEKEVVPLLSGTQCAHLIWAAFTAAGYDIDSDGGLLVTPRDIAQSPLFEVVQIYGLDPAEVWP